MSEHQQIPRKAPVPSGRPIQHSLLPLDQGAGLLAFTEKRRVMVVDHVPLSRRTLRDMIADLGHDVIEASSTSEALNITSREIIDLIMVDFLAPELGGTAFCCVLRSHFRTHSVPVFLLSGTSDPEQEARAIGSGADDFLVRPFTRKVLRARVQSALRRGTLLDSTDQAEGILFSLAQAVEARDVAVGQHCQRLALISSTLGVTLGLPAHELITLQRGGFLHDIGKVSVPDSILFKRGPLTPEEWITMKEHTIRGEKICSGMKALEPVLPIVRSHHERWDGTGYPDGLHGEETPVLARILQIADIFDALTTERPYKPAYSPDYAVQVLREETKAGWRDPRLVEAFSDIYRLFETEEPTSNSSLLALALSLKQRNGWLPHEHSPAAGVLQASSNLRVIKEAM
jgi:putative two-component system response regulator